MHIPWVNRFKFKLWVLQSKKKAAKVLAKLYFLVIVASIVDFVLGDLWVFVVDQIKYTHAGYNQDECPLCKSKHGTICRIISALTLVVDRNALSKGVHALQELAECK